MHIPVLGYITLGGWVLTATIFAGLVYRHKRAARKLLDAADTWLEDAERALESDDKSLLMELRDPPRGSLRLQKVRDMRDHLQHESHRHVQAIKLEEARKGNATKVAALRAQGSYEEHYDELAQLGERRFDGYDSLYGDDAQWLTEQLTALANAKAERLLERARAGDARSFLELGEFTSSLKNYYALNQEEYYLRQTDGAVYRTPEDWDDLAVRLLEHPRLSDFRLQVGYADRPTGFLSELAATALRTRQLLPAQYVLAHCSHKRGYRDEIGEILYTELVKLVEELHAERPVVTPSTITTE